MMQHTKPEEGTLLNEESVRKISAAKKEPEWLLRQRLAALNAFEELPMPQQSYGLHLSPPVNIAISDIRPFENITRHRSSEKGVVVCDLSVAAAKYEKLLRPLMSGREFHNRIEALHAAFWNSGVLIYAQKGESAARAAIRMSQKETEIINVIAVAEENAGLEVTESLTQAITGKKSCRIESVSVYAGRGSTVKYATLQKLGASVNSIISRMAQAEGSVDWTDITLGGGSTRQETMTMLNSEGASSTVTGAFFCSGSQQLDIHAREVHNARNTASSIKIKGALHGMSKAIIQSFTKITGSAAGSEGHQKANVLLLSDTARASPIPKLEIDNCDVKASHEASVGQLDREKLFYLMSRGIGETEAKMLAVEGFFEPLLKCLPAELAEDMRKTVRERLEG